jgi:hypothetical protein
MDTGNNVVAINNDLGITWLPERRVEDSPLLRDVDLFAAEHGVDLAVQIDFIRQREEQRQRLVRDALLRVIEVDPVRLDRHRLPALRIGRKEIAQHRAGLRLPVGIQRPPLRGLRNKRHLHSFLPSPVSQERGRGVRITF